jgi:hypothetical protein
LDTHRLEAAKRLGLRPTIVIVADDTADPETIIPDVYAKRSQTVRELRATFVDYLADVIPRVQDHPKRRLDELLPGSWARAHAHANAAA